MSLRFLTAFIVLISIAPLFPYPERPKQGRLARTNPKAPRSLLGLGLRLACSRSEFESPAKRQRATRTLSAWTAGGNAVLPNLDASDPLFLVFTGQLVSSNQSVHMPFAEREHCSTIGLKPPSLLTQFVAQSANSLRVFPIASSPNSRS